MSCGAKTTVSSGTLRCPAERPLSAQERRPERDGSLRVLCAARIGHCRSCRLREQCQELATTLKARRVSAVYWPLSSPASISGESPPAPGEPSPPPASHRVLWGDWQRRFHRREVVKLLRSKPRRYPAGRTVSIGAVPTRSTAFPCRASTLASILVRALGTQCSPQSRSRCLD